MLLQVPDEIYVKKPSAITLRFTNPLKTSLTKCKFSISGSNSLRSQIIQHGDVKPGGALKVDTQIILRLPGTHKIIAVFDSNELRDITGSVSVEVSEDY